MMRWRILLSGLSLVSVFHSAVLAESNGGGFSFAMQASIPQEEFANVSERGGGLGIAIMYFPWASHFHGFRLDFGYTGHPKDTREVPGGEIETTYRSIMSTLGFQLSAPIGPLLFYVAPSGGIYHYWTTERFNEEGFGDVKFDTTKPGWNIGVGLFVQMGSATDDKEQVVGLEIAAKYHTIHNVIRSEVTGLDGNANVISIHVGLVYLPKWWWRTYAIPSSVDR